jgi:hypothetical protein
MTTTTAIETKEDLQKLTRAQALAFFSTLPAASHEELDGEYEGFLMWPENEEAARRSAEFMSRWMGKAYKRTGPNSGEGYNRWRQESGVSRWMRFATDVAPSNFDGKTVFRMRYGAFRNDPGAKDLVDEIRRVRPGLYLCIATLRADDGGRTPPGPFGLAGPVGPWVGVDDPKAEVI